VTRLPPVPIPATLRQRSPRDLCFSFARARVDPIWVIDRIELNSEATSQ
jgi:hypothetical protein